MARCLEGEDAMKDNDEVTYPGHYAWIPGIECKDVSKHFSSMVGQAIQYQWRHLRKGKPIEDLEKTVECLKVEIERLKNESSNSGSNQPIKEVDRPQGNCAERFYYGPRVVEIVWDTGAGSMVRSLRMGDGGPSMQNEACSKPGKTDSGRQEAAHLGKGFGILDK